MLFHLAIFVFCLALVHRELARRRWALRHFLLCFALALCGCQPGLRADTLPVVLTGQLAPGTAEGRFEWVKPAFVNGSGVIVFHAGYAGGYGHEGIFELSEGRLSPVAIEGQPVPDFPCVTFGNFGEPQINNSGDVVFNATLNNGATGLQAVFISSAGALRKIVDTEMQVPGAVGQRFTALGNVRVNDVADIAFSAALSSDGSIRSGIFLVSQGSIRAVAFTGQPLPGTSQIYDALTPFSLNNHHDFALLAGSRVFLLSDGSATAVASPGQPVPNANLMLHGMTEPSINDAKEIVFVNQKEVCCNRGGTYLSPNGIVRFRAGVLEKIAAEGDPVAGFAGAVFDKGFFHEPQIDNFGGVVFSAGMTLNYQHADVIVTAEGGKLTAVAHGGEFIDGIGTMDFMGQAHFNESKNS